MIYSKEVENMCTVAKGPKHGPAPIPEEGKWVKSYDIKDISGLSHGIGWCAPQQGACKLSLNVKNKKPNDPHEGYFRQGQSAHHNRHGCPQLPPCNGQVLLQ